MLLFVCGNHRIQLRVPLLGMKTQPAVERTAAAFAELGACLFYRNQ